MGLEVGNADQLPQVSTATISTNLGRLLNDEKMVTLKSRCEGYMSPISNFQVLVDNEPPSPNFSNVNPQVLIERDRRAWEDLNA